MEKIVIVLACFAALASAGFIGKNIDEARSMVYNQAINTSELCLNQSSEPPSCSDFGPISLIPHPEDCRLFYYCIASFLPPICRQCPSILHFNPDLLVCDWPDRAGCNATAHTEGPTDTTPEYNSTTVAETETPEPTSEGPEPTSEGPEPTSEATEVEAEATTESDVPEPSTVVSETPTSPEPTSS